MYPYFTGIAKGAEGRSPLRAMACPGPAILPMTAVRALSTPRVSGVREISSTGAPMIESPERLRTRTWMTTVSPTRIESGGAMISIATGWSAPLERPSQPQTVKQHAAASAAWENFRRPPCPPRRAGVAPRDC